MLLHSICRVPLNTLTAGNSPPLDLTATGTAQRYRLVDCDGVVNQKVLEIRETVDFPPVPYAALSYVWRGNPVDPAFSDAVFTVNGAEDADPIGVSVLNDTCVAALAHRANYLWIDRLCILQTSPEDKRWQIREMGRIYKSCALCIIAPGGLQRLVRLDEETEWIHRGWTLQEALAPPSALVLFSWKLGSTQTRAGENSWGSIEEVVPTRSATAPLSLMLDACTTGYLELSIQLKSGNAAKVQTTIFSSGLSDQSFDDMPLWQPPRQIMSPNVSALALAMSKDTDADIKAFSIWQSALMRTSSRPVDMVFSIMDLFNVNLDPSKFEKNDRLGATVALIQGILDQGGRMSWLGISCLAPPCPQLSTFPTFPHTRVAGKALVKVPGGYCREVSQLMLSEYPNAEALVQAPIGRMDDEGYITFVAKATPMGALTDISAQEISKTTPYDDSTKPTRLKAVDGSVWGVSEIFDNQPAQTGPNVQPRSFAVLVGLFYGYYPGMTPAHDANNVRAMLVQEHAPARFHVKSYFMLSLNSRAWVSTWPEQSFTIGGPESMTQLQERGEPEDDIECYPRATFELDQELLFNPMRINKPAVTLRGHSARHARFALSQEWLEHQLMDGQINKEGRLLGLYGDLNTGKFL